MIKQTKEAKTVYGILYTEPFWSNNCKHPKNSYVGSIKKCKLKLDVYVYTDKSSKNIEACIRFGNRRHQYYSPGLLKYVLWSANAGDDIYEAAVYVLEYFGQIAWRRNTKKEKK
jgi:hypothetical protein